MSSNKRPKVNGSVLWERLKKELTKGESLCTVFVRAIKPSITDEQVTRFVQLSRGTVKERIPMNDGPPQFRVEIRKAYCEALQEALNLIEFQKKPFTGPPHTRPLSEFDFDQN